MKISNIAALSLLAPCVVSGFIPFSSTTFQISHKSRSGSLNGLLQDEDSLEKAVARQVDYKPGAADSDFAKRYGHLAGQKVKTVGEAFAEFTNLLGHPINALYKNMMTDIVGSTHLVVVSARFQRDAIWSLGLISSLNLLLKNYPEKDICADIVSSLMKSVQLDEETIKAEAKSIEEWAQGKTREEVAAALKGEGDSPVAQIAKGIKDEQYWMYSKYFGIGLIRIMEIIGIEVDMETGYAVMEDWVGGCLEKPFYTACSDSDQYFKVKNRLDQMETLMKEVEIREKKRLAQRLEEKAEAALRQAEKETKLQKEIEAEGEKAQS